MASKRMCAILMFIVLNVGLSYAQQTQTIDVISLKSGGKINGKIIEKKDGESVTILTLPANETMKIRWEDIKDISTMTVFSSQSYNINSLTSVQQASDSGFTSYWLDAGIGVGSPGLAGGVSASYLWGHTLYTVRYVYDHEIALFFTPTPLESAWDVGFLYGMAARNQMFYSSASVGIGVTGGVRRGSYISFLDYESDAYTTIGIPLQGELFLTPVSFVGIGVTAFGNLNPVRSFGGVLVCLRVGKLW